MTNRFEIWNERTHKSLLSVSNRLNVLRKLFLGFKVFISNYLLLWICIGATLISYLLKLYTQVSNLQVKRQNSFWKWHFKMIFFMSFETCIHNFHISHESIFSDLFLKNDADQCLQNWRNERDTAWAIYKFVHHA